jgi:hypothetical protein
MSPDPARPARRRRAFGRRLAAGLGAFPGATLALGLALPAAAGPPPEGRCPGFHRTGDPGGDDAVPRRMAPGVPLGYDHLASLQDLLPEEIWSNRKVFFFPGMHMVIGDCHRHYPVPAFHEEATRRFAVQVKLDAEGNLEGYVAGTPFPPEQIDLGARDAGLRWAWNLEHRFRGAGPVGHFRIVDVAGRVGSDRSYEGEFFFLQTSHRADLAASGYAEPDARGNLWVAGGRFEEPTDARHLAWRQMRPTDALQDHDQPDDTFVYVPTMRKMRRAASAWVDGVYMPRFRTSGDAGGGGLPTGGNEFSGPQGSVNPTAGESIQVTENLREGFTALALRPNAYVWRLRGEREVIAPLNVAWPGYPIERERNFGPFGLSIASDRWDVRWAVVVDGLPRERTDYEMLTLYIDWQTQQPLYVVTKTRRGRILEVGIPVHRYSEDTLDYPTWPNGERARVFDPVAEVFYRVSDDSGWRRESYDVHSTPADPRLRRRFTASDYLVRGR